MEDVNLIVASAREKQTAREILKRSHVDLKRVKFHIWPTNRIWTRDSGPIFVRNQNVRRPHQLALQRLGQISRLEA